MGETWDIDTPRSAWVLRVPNGHRGRYFLDSGMPWNFRRSRSQVKKLEAGHFRSGVQGNWEQHVTLKPEPPSPDLRYPHPLDLLEENLGVELDGFLGADFWKVGCFTVSPARGKVVFGTVSQAVDIKLDLAESPLDGDNRPYATIRWEGKERTSLVDTGSVPSFSSRLLRPGDYPVSKGWRNPALTRLPGALYDKGRIVCDYFSGVPLVVGGREVLSTVAVPRQHPDSHEEIPDIAVLGQDVLARFAVTFDLGRGRIGLTAEHRSETRATDPIRLEAGLYHAGIQVGLRDGRATVSNLLDDCPNAGKVKVDDVLELPGVALDGRDAINVLDQALSGREPGEVEVIVNGSEKRRLVLAPLFSASST